MPICSKCHLDKERSAFTNKQLSKISSIRRCYKCVEAVQTVENETNQKRKDETNAKKAADKIYKHNDKLINNGSDYCIEKVRSKLSARTKNAVLFSRDASLLSRKDQPAMQELVAEAAAKVMERGIPKNVGLDNFCQEKLVARLWEIVNNRDMIWLTRPLLHGLIKGGRAMNEKVSFDPATAESIPLLHWLCQIKLWRRRAYCGAEDMVALALMAGADVNSTGSNKTNALFFAVKYTSARCVEVLLDANVDVTQKDIYGHTMWKNAIERPDIHIIETLIRRCNEVIPISKERFTHNMFKQNQQKLEFTMVDHMLSIYAGKLPNYDSLDPRSWLILGDPTIDELAMALIRVLQAGSRFSPTAAVLQERINADPMSTLLADTISIVTHIGSPRLSMNCDQFQFDIMCYLRNVIFGRRLPELIQQEIASSDRMVSKDETCPICLTDMDGDGTFTTLYCGHRYCVDCIKAYGESHTPVRTWIEGNYMIMDPGNLEKRCPICRRLICGVIANTPRLIEGMHETTRAHFPSQRSRLGIDRHEAIKEVGIGNHGPQVLTDDQLRFECKAVMNKSEGTREELLQELLDFIEHSNVKSGVGECIVSGGNPIPIDLDTIRIELSSTFTLVGGRDNQTKIFPPQNGPVVIPIVIKGVPVLSYLSPNSFVTVVPISVVKTFGLSTKPMASNRFTSYDGRQVSVSAVVEELKFLLGDIEICLNNAVVVENEVEGLMDGVRLGMDFFESADGYVAVQDLRVIHLLLLMVERMCSFQIKQMNSGITLVMARLASCHSYILQIYQIMK